MITPEERSRVTGTKNEEPSKTLQGPAVEADINFIARTYGLTGRNLPIPDEVYDPRYYGDMDDAVDLHSAMEVVRDASEKFMRLPAELRHRFKDSPGYLWEFVNDPRNAEEAVTLGLLHRPPPEPEKGAVEPAP